MINEERIKVGEAWLALAQVYEKDISKASLSMMLDSVDDLPSKKILDALRIWSRTSKQSRHPYPAEIRQLILPEIEDLVIANEAASRVMQAVPKFGLHGWEEAKKFVGELGWLIVSRFGGWGYLCENLGVSLSVTMFQAQAREIARSQFILAKHNLHNTPPAIEAIRDQSQVSGVIKELAEKKKMDLE